MPKHPLLPCPRCMHHLIERGLIYPGGKVVSRELAPKLRSVLKGDPLGVEYECAHCGSTQRFTRVA